jgi:hypothetical protein
MQRLLCGGNSQILEETILYAVLDVLAKCLESKFLTKFSRSGLQPLGVLKDGGPQNERLKL